MPWEGEIVIIGISTLGNGIILRKQIKTAEYAAIYFASIRLLFILSIVWMWADGRPKRK